MGSDVGDDHGDTDDHGGGHVSIYGAILIVGSVRTSIVLICLFTFLTMLEYSLRAIQKFSERYKFDLLFEKLKQELMILGTTRTLDTSLIQTLTKPFTHLGIISFASFIVESSIESLDYDLFLSFEVCHILVLFIALAFMLMVVHSLTHSLTQLLTHSLTHSLIRIGHIFNAVCSFYYKDLFEGCSDGLIRHRRGL